MKGKHMRGSFYGWYLKCQSDTQTLVVIPAVHKAGRIQTCLIQILTDSDIRTATFNVDINGQEYSFQNALGYWEGDRGKSFPKRYIWTQCCFPEGSLMLSVADIPMAGSYFTGIIGFVLWKGKEYRIDTYLGARVVQIQNKIVRIIQGSLELEVRLLKVSSRPLKAPKDGDMMRTIHESAACRVYYRFCVRTGTLFCFETDRASFEYEYV